MLAAVVAAILSSASHICKPHTRKNIGKLPLLELEAEGAEALKAKGVDCLTIFLAPPSEEVFDSRLRAWLTESDEEIAARQVCLIFGVLVLRYGRVFGSQLRAW